MKRLLLICAMFTGSAFGQTPTLANEWVNTTAGGSPARNSSPASYNSATAFGSFSAAQAAAHAGDTVIIKAGSYAAQTLSANQQTSTVNYWADSPGSVTLTGDLNISIDHVHFHGIISAGGFDTRHSVSVNGSSSFTDLAMDCENAGGWLTMFWGTPEVQGLNNCDIGNGDECNHPALEDALRWWSPGSGNLTVFIANNITVHDWNKSNTGCDSNHVDLFQVFPGSGTAGGMQLSNSKFYNGDTSDVLTQSITGLWHFWNDYFGQPVHGGNVLVLGRGDCSGILVEFSVIDWNTMNNTGDSVNGCTVSGGIFRSIIFPSSITACSVDAGPAPTGDHNIFIPGSATTCGTSAKNCNPTWLNGVPSNTNTYDFRLSASDTCAKNSGSTGAVTVDGTPFSFPTTDYYGTSRPQFVSPYVGPFEVVNGGVTPSPSNGPSIFVISQMELIRERVRSGLAQAIRNLL